MIFYHGTSKDYAMNIKTNGFSWDYAGSQWGSTYGKAIYFTNNYKEAECYAGVDGEVLKVEVVNYNPLKLTKDYSPSSKKHVSEIRTIIMYCKLNSTKNCLVNIHNNEFIFFNKFDYKIYL